MCNDGNEDAVSAYAKNLLGPARYVAYQGSKFAIARWMRRVAGTWAARGIRINAVAPGATMTPLMEAGMASADFGKAMRNVPVPVNFKKESNCLAAEEIAKVIVFLTGPDATAMAGAVVYADGATDALMRTERF